MFAFSNASAEAVEKLLEKAGIRGYFLGVIGALSAGMRAAWVRRSPEAIFDAWDIEPTIIVPGLEDLAQRIKETRST